MYNKIDATMAYVTGAYSFNSGGGCMIDCIELPTGRVIGITDECICIYENDQQLMNGEGSEQACIDLTVTPAKAYKNTDEVIDSMAQPVVPARPLTETLKDIQEAIEAYQNGKVDYDNTIVSLFSSIDDERDSLYQDARHRVTLLEA